MERFTFSTDKRANRKLANKLSMVLRNAILDRLKGGLPLDKGIGHALDNLGYIGDDKAKFKKLLLSKYSGFKDSMYGMDLITPKDIEKLKKAAQKASVKLPKDFVGIDSITIISNTPFDTCSLGAVANITGIDKTLFEVIDDTTVVLTKVNPYAIFEHCISELSIYGIEGFSEDLHAGYVLKIAYA